MRNLAAVSVVLLAAACSHQQRAASSSEYMQSTSETVQTEPSQAQPQQAIAQAQPRTFQCVPCSQRQPVAGRACPQAKVERQNVAGRSCPIVRVHFAFDDDTLSADAKAALKRNAECFRQGKAVINVEGNADERGSESYNQDLGQRRAHAVVGFLAQQGVPASELHAVSFGKDRPLCLGHTESCWQQNRRVTLRPSNLSASTPRTIE